MGEDIAASAMRKIARRILPFVFLLYIVAYLDRANVAFANLPMRTALGFSEAVFGFGAGVFFLGYVLLEIPGALLVERWSARRWIARILVTWGMFTVLVGFVRTPAEFYGARFLLGAAEAGFFPGILVYLTHWFAAPARARATAAFMVAAPVSLMIGAPLSALILKLNWMDLPGWRWIFILQGIPAVLLGFVTLFYLTDHPREARWLRPEERDWIHRELEAEKRQKPDRGRLWWRALGERNVLLLAAASFGANVAGYGFVLWLPNTMSRVLGLHAGASALLTGIPFFAAICGALVGGWSSDRRNERKWHACIPLAAASLFLALAAVPDQPPALALVSITLTAAAAYAWTAPFWVLPSLSLKDSAAAASFGWINSIGSLGGFVGPFAVGFLLSWGWPYGTVLAVLSLTYAATAAAVAFIRVQVPRADAPHSATIGLSRGESS